jgi:hypothetical protein
MAEVTLRITGIPNPAAAHRKSLAFARVVGNDIVLKSPLEAKSSLNEHLVWLWGTLQGERRYLKSLQSEGAEILVQAFGATEPIEIKPNGAEMLHILGATLMISSGK